MSVSKLGFRLSENAKDYFSNLCGSSEDKLDYMEVYYCCCVVGMLCKDISHKNKGEIFLQYVHTKFNNNYSFRYKELMLLLLNTEVKRIGISTDDREKMKKICAGLFVSSNEFNLTSEGMQRLNDYCEAGCIIMQEKSIAIDDIHTLLSDFHILVQQLVPKYCAKG